MAAKRAGYMRFHLAERRKWPVRVTGPTFNHLRNIVANFNLVLSTVTVLRLLPDIGPRPPARPFYAAWPRIMQITSCAVS